MRSIQKKKNEILKKKLSKGNIFFFLIIIIKLTDATVFVIVYISILRFKKFVKIK